uniref:Mitogen-activated protein kinase n=1 Tax=Hyaloperonospora arabidopsidis (strain Emoy2) TaxID=559515 RepID=M4BGQ2_HYAAE
MEPPAASPTARRSIDCRSRRELSSSSRAEPIKSPQKCLERPLRAPSTSLLDAIGAKRWMQLIPIKYDGPARKRREWLPHWDDVYLSLDGLTLRVFDSHRRFLEQQKQQQQQQKSGRSSKSTTRLEDVTHGYIVTAVDVETTSRPHAFVVKTTTKEKKDKTLHLAVSSELEKVLWVHLLGAVVEQVQKVLPKARKRLKAAGYDVASLQKKPLAASPLSTYGGARTQTLTLLGTPVRVDLAIFYDAWGCIQARRGNFASLMPSLHPNITLTSNYPPSVPIAGVYHGLSGMLTFFAKLHGSMDLSHYGAKHIARCGDLAVVSGRETIRSANSGRRFRHLWKHELRFEADGRISYINILADKTAASIAFANGGGTKSGPVTDAAAAPTLAALPREREQQTSTCPPGELRVVCISGERFRMRKPASRRGSGYKVILGLNGFPHCTKMSPGPNCIGSTISRDVITTTIDGLSCVGSWKSYSTRVVQSSGGRGPIWAETLHVEFSGAVPGLTAALCVDVWGVGVLGDELIGCAKINLAKYLDLSEGTEEEIASAAVPNRFDIYRAECFEKAARRGENESCGGLELSISFVPYTKIDGSIGKIDAVGITDEWKASGLPIGEATSNQDGHFPVYRKSFDRLHELHDETGHKQQPSECDSLAGSDVTSDCELVEATNYVGDQDKQKSAIEEEMYSFTVASTKFRVYRRYQLIRAIGHGAYGVVIAASDRSTGKSVAIKNVPRTFDDLVDAKRIVREIRLMRHMHHPYIVSLLDVMRPPSLSNFEDTYIVTDLMETDLHRVINSPEALSSDHIAFITYQLLCGLRYVHSAHVVHRDVKPSNVLINRDCLVKLCDFGLARGIDMRPVTLNGKDGNDTPSSQDGELVLDDALTEYVVTRWYRAPELLLASRYSTAIDLWAVGCILAEMFMRKALFPGHDHVHQLHLILQLVGSPPPDEMGFITNIKARRWMARQPQQEGKLLGSVCPNAPAEALDLMKKLLRFDPCKRISVDDAIAHPFLAPFRADGAELSSESLAESTFDFSFERKNRGNMDTSTLRRLIFEDVCHFHPEAFAELKQFTQEQERSRLFDEEKRRKEEDGQNKMKASKVEKSWAASV